MRVLIVDDNADITEITSELLSLMGHDCRTAACAADALAVVQAFKPELAILDIGLPDLSGYDLLWELRSRLAPQALFVAALTGWPEACAKSLVAGFDRCLLKPATSEQLCRVVELAQAASVRYLVSRAPGA
jgi:DNA-binding response OmpR family regulator